MPTIPEYKFISTADFTKDVVNVLRSYLWYELTQNSIFTAENYYSDSTNSTLIPLFPVQQSPEMVQLLSGKKHIIFDRVGTHSDTLWAISTDRVRYTIFSSDISELQEIVNFMTDLFRRMDDSAKEVNQYPGVMDHFKFHSIQVTDVSDTKPQSDLGGPYSVDMILDVKYSRQVDSNGRFS